MTCAFHTTLRMGLAQRFIKLCMDRSKPPCGCTTWCFVKERLKCQIQLQTISTNKAYVEVLGQGFHSFTNAFNAVCNCYNPLKEIWSDFSPVHRSFPSNHCLLNRFLPTATTL